MYDLDCKTSENKLRRFFVTNLPILEDLLRLKQADFSACMDDCSPAPTCVRWRALLEKMQAEHAPFQTKDLALSGKDLLNAGLPAPHIAMVLNGLLLHTAVNPQDNQTERLLKIAHSIEKNLAER
jgi:poly(A) polymerase/tRNA nucleotidyltransferase (CCA-adding enzyme)